jgi:hypothetical protein
VPEIHASACGADCEVGTSFSLLRAKSSSYQARA